MQPQQPSASAHGPAQVVRFLLAGLMVFFPLSLTDAVAQQTSLDEVETGVAAAEGTAAFAAARSLAESGRTQDAISAYARALRAYPLAPGASQAQFELAQLYESTGNTTRAFRAYQTLLDNYPDTPHFDTAVAAQVAMANAMLEKRPTKVLGVQIQSTVGRAQEMYTDILTSAPFSKFAPIAQFNLGLSFERQSKPFEAIKAYQAVLDTYPNSDVADDALYQIAYVYMRIGFADQSEDLSSLILAKETFEDFLIEYPDSEKAPQAQDNLNMIGGREAGDILRIAQFYEFQRNYKAAVIYYNDVIRRQPNTDDASLARSRIEELRAEFGEDVLRPNPERPETGEQVAIRRRLQAQVETSALADFSGPPVRSIVPPEESAGRSRMRTSAESIRPLPAVEPELPTE